MDVTSQLNLEREAGMGENTERRPAEPAGAGGGGRAQARGGRGPRAAPGGDEQRLPRPPPGFRPRQLRGRARGLLPRAASPTKDTFFRFPLEKQHTPKQRTEINRYPGVVDHGPGSLPERRLRQWNMKFFFFWLVFVFFGFFILFFGFSSTRGGRGRGLGRPQTPANHP